MQNFVGENSKTHCKVFRIGKTLFPAPQPSHPISRSTSCRKQHGLHLNAFRGVRAISEFDWPFTPTLTSSGSFSTLIGAVLHFVLPKLQPGQG